MPSTQRQQPISFALWLKDHVLNDYKYALKVGLFWSMAAAVVNLLH